MGVQRERKARGEHLEFCQRGGKIAKPVSAKHNVCGGTETERGGTLTGNHSSGGGKKNKAKRPGEAEGPRKP